MFLMILEEDCKLIPPSLGSWDKPIGMVLKKRNILKGKKGDGLLTGLLGLPQNYTWNNIPLLGQII